LGTKAGVSVASQVGTRTHGWGVLNPVRQCRLFEGLPTLASDEAKKQKQG